MTPIKQNNLCCLLEEVLSSIKQKTEKLRDVKDIKEDSISNSQMLEQIYLKFKKMIRYSMNSLVIALKAHNKEKMKK